MLESQLSKAISCFKKRLEIAREQQNTQQETHILLELGRTCMLTNENQSACEHDNKALEIAEERGHEQEKLVRSKIDQIDKALNIVEELEESNAKHALENALTITGGHLRFAITFIVYTLPFIVT